MRGGRAHRTRAISIAPGGFLGFYMLGTAAYVKHNYRIDDCAVGGESAGSIVAMYALSRHSDDALLERCLFPFLESMRAEPVPRTWSTMTTKLQGALAAMDCDLDRAFVRTSALHAHRPYVRSRMDYGFASEDALVERVRMSCFIPLVMGALSYRNHVDAIFTRAPAGEAVVPAGCKQVLHISADMWRRNFSFVDSAIDVSVERCVALGALGYVDAWRNDATLRRALPRRGAWGRARAFGAQLRCLRTAARLLAP